MIRCEKCGYANKASATKCVKCHAPLMQEQPSYGTAANQGKTVMDAHVGAPSWDAANKTREVVIPVPQPVPPANDHGKTVVRRAAVSEKGFALAALSPDDEQEVRKIPLTGPSVNLNRDLLDAGNTSISRKGHAVLTFRDGAWWIENVSDLQTTFVRVNQPVKLAEGDVFMIGDSLYRLKAEK